MFINVQLSVFFSLTLYLQMPLLKHIYRIFLPKETCPYTVILIVHRALEIHFFLHLEGHVFVLQH